MIQHDSFQRQNSCSPPRDSRSLQTQLRRCICLPDTRYLPLVPFLLTGEMEQRAHSHCCKLLQHTLY
uniref:Uncharacterized protein n=1 Tax=Arundo donax TaxID=35708 RepID=A0A0A9AM11_ARUDO